MDLVITYSNCNKTIVDIWNQRVEGNDYKHEGYNYRHKGNGSKIKLHFIEILSKD